MDKLKPDFIIVGVMKGGTSTLAYLLSKQDDIVMAPGEVNFFDNINNYRKGYTWYIKQFKSADNNKFWGEKTATYHYDENVPERIYQYNPEVKLIWIFRNPIHRAYSNYWHRVKYGLETNTFENAIMKELKGSQEDKWGLYLKRSLYIDQVKVFSKYFNNDQMLFIVFEQFVTDIETNLRKVLKFIGIENNHLNIPQRKTKNITYLPSSPKFLGYSRKLFGDTIAFKFIRKLIENRKPGYPDINDFTRNKLQTYFTDSIEELEKFSKIDLSVWIERGK